MRILIFFICSITLLAQTKEVYKFEQKSYGKVGELDTLWEGLIKVNDLYYKIDSTQFEFSNDTLRYIFQNLSISNDTLSISNGNFVVLPSSGGGDDSLPAGKYGRILLHNTSDWYKTNQVYLDSINNNFYFGELAGQNSTGSSNLFLGFSTGAVNSGDWNTGVGINALTSNHGDYNIGLGYESGYNVTTGSYGVTIGYRAGYQAINDNNVYIGFQAGYGSAGQQNIGIGRSAANNLTQQDIIAIGDLSCLSCSGRTVIGIGKFAGLSSSADRSVYLGYYAGNNSSGDYGIAVGDQSAYNNTGTNIIAIGRNAGYGNTKSNRLIINSSSSTSDTYLIDGDFLNDTLRINGELKVRDAFYLPSLAGTETLPLAIDASGRVTTNTTSNNLKSEFLKFNQTINTSFTNSQLRISVTDSVNVVEVGLFCIVEADSSNPTISLSLRNNAGLDLLQEVYRIDSSSADYSDGFNDYPYFYVRTYKILVKDNVTDEIQLWLSGNVEFTLLKYSYIKLLQLE